MVDALEVGMKLHAVYSADGEYYPAVIAAISESKKRSKAPVQVSFTGYDEKEWKALSDLKSKKLPKVEAKGKAKAKAKAKAKGEKAKAPKPSDPKCPFLSQQIAPMNEHPQKLDLKILHHSDYLNGRHTREQYMQDLTTLDMGELKKDVVAALKDSQSWWPADYGHYGPFMVRLAWHSAGTYRSYDGRGGGGGGNIRMNPLDSWRDNGNLDKAKRILWPVKQKYGKKLSWADLILLAGNAGMEDMGFKSFGFGMGRVDISAREEEIYWGTDQSYKGLAKNISKLENTLGAVEMHLIYVNPEGPDAIPNPLLAAAHVKESFGRMSMNSEETVALIAGGHTFGKCHGAVKATNVGAAPNEAAIEQQGFGWKNKHKSGVGEFACTSGLEGAWTENPAKWDHGYFTTLFKYEWELFKSPAGAQQWRPKKGAGNDTVPHAHLDKKTHPIMLTTDLALREDPEFNKISKRFLENPDEFADAYARAWYKLIHRDLGPARRLLGPEVAPEQKWQDPITPLGGNPISDSSAKTLKAEILGAGLSPTQLASVAWASASTWRHTDCRGGANGARIRLAPQNGWAVNNPSELEAVLGKLQSICDKFNGSAPAGEKVSMADMIVLGGVAGVEAAAQAAGNPVQVEFKAGRGDATAEQTDPVAQAWLEPEKDAFRNYKARPFDLVDRAHLLGLSVNEMTVLVAGLRALGVTAPGADGLGVLTDTPGQLDNAFCRNLTDMKWQWKRAAKGTYDGVDRASGEKKWRASAVDLTFGSNPELRAVIELYACDDGKQAFADDFAKAWSKVMHADMYDGKW